MRNTVILESHDERHRPLTVEEMKQKAEILRGQMLLALAVDEVCGTEGLTPEQYDSIVSQILDQDS